MCRENKGTYIICCQTCLLPAPQHCWNPLSQVIHDPVCPRKTWPEGCLSKRWGSQWQYHCILTHCCWSGNTALAMFFFPSCFCTWSNCFHESLFHFYTIFSVSSLHCLLTSCIKTQFRNWSILRSSEANMVYQDSPLQVGPGTHLPRECWSPP